MLPEKENCTQDFLNAGQYKRNGILRYERVFGHTFVSTGGLATTKVKNNNLQIPIQNFMLSYTGMLLSEFRLNLLKKFVRIRQSFAFSPTKILMTSLPCPFTGPKMFWAGPNFLCQTKNLFTYCGSDKHFVPEKKMICNQ